MVNLVAGNLPHKQRIDAFWQQYGKYSDAQLEAMSSQLKSPLRIDAYGLFQSVQQGCRQEEISMQVFDELFANLISSNQLVSTNNCLLLSLLRQWWQEWAFALSMATKEPRSPIIENNEYSAIQSGALKSSHYTNLFAQVPIPLCNVCTVTGNIISLNQRFVDVFGYDIDDIPTLQQWWLNAYPDPQYRERVQQRWQKAMTEASLSNTDIEPQNYLVSCKNGSQITMEISGTIIDSEYLAIFKDVTQRLAVEDKLRDMAFLDSLTEIANRRCFDDTLSAQLALMKEQLKPISMILIDIDNFKQYNDNYGHLKGDQCLYQIAQCIASLSANTENFVARYGGEEFVVLIPNCDAKQALSTALEIQQTINQLAIEHDYSELGYITLSMGINTLDNLKGEENIYFVEDADKALYQAKGKGRNTIVVSND